MRGNELSDVLHHDGKDGIAKLLHRVVPLLDDSSDECLLDDERVATREFPCAGSSKGEQVKFRQLRKDECSLMSVLEDFVDANNIGPAISLLQ
jgi:hypothetical protein